MINNVLMKGKTLNLGAIKKRTFKQTPKNLDSFRGDLSVNESGNMSKQTPTYNRKG